MTDRPILFSAPMVRALLGGRKTQTRRALSSAAHLQIASAPDLPVSCLHVEGEKVPRLTLGRVITIHKLKAAVGDRLWVRERFLPDPPSDDPSWDDNVCTYVEWAGCGSRISDVPPALRASAYSIYAANPTWGEDSGMVWRPSIHMPRWASRLTLIVTDVRVERLQAISEADAVAEGCFKGKASGRVFANEAAMHIGGDEWANARDWYADIWEAINGPGAWEANPWVAAYTFTVIPKNIDEA